MSNFVDHPMPSFEVVYQFLRDEYIHSRFEGRNADWPKGVPEGGTYAELVARSCMATLERDHGDLISHFESRRGKVVRFNRALEVLNPDAPPVEIRHKASSLSAPMAGIW